MVNLLTLNSEFLDGHIADNTAVAIVDLSNYGFLRDCCYTSEHPYYGMFGYMYNMSHQMFFRGDSIAALRIFEIIAAIRNIKKYFNELECAIYAEGRIEFLTAAALLIGGTCENYKLAGRFEGFTSIINNRLYDYGDIKSYIIPALLQYCDYQDITRWLCD